MIDHMIQGSNPDRGISHTAYTVANSTALGAIATSFFQFLPPFISTCAAISGLLWSCIMIYESSTFQRFLARVGGHDVTVTNTTTVRTTTTSEDENYGHD